jgi:hypothetical protein
MAAEDMNVVNVVNVFTNAYTREGTMERNKEGAENVHKVHNVHPHYSRTEPCAALAYATRSHSVAICRKEGFPHRWQRMAAEYRAGRGGSIANPIEISSKWKSLATISEYRKG